MGLGIGLVSRAQLGMVPMDVLHAATADLLNAPLSIGIAVTQIVVILLWIPARLRPQPGTLISLLVPAAACHLTEMVIAPITTLTMQCVGMVCGGVVFSVGVAAYLAADWGASPRDGLITWLHRKLDTPYGPTRAVIDILCVAAGWAMLGWSNALNQGVVGVGSIALAVLSGLLVGRLLRTWTSTPAARATVQT